MNYETLPNDEMDELSWELNWLKNSLSVDSHENKETSFWWIRLSYNWKYEVPWINQETILNNKYKSQFPDTLYSDCRLDIKPNKWERMWTVVCWKSLITSLNWKNRYEPHKESFYSQRVLPWKDLIIPWRHVAEDGTIRDKDWFIVIASPVVKKGQVDPYPKGTKIMTTLWPWKVYDKWWMTWKWFDIYTDWNRKIHRNKNRDWKWG